MSFHARNEQDMLLNMEGHACPLPIDNIIPGSELLFSIQIDLRRCCICSRPVGKCAPALCEALGPENQYSQQ